MPKQVTSNKLKVKNTIPGGKLNNFLNNLSDRVTNFKTSKTFYIILIVVGLTLLFFFKKSWFIAATVNSMPVTNWELQTKLNQQFRTQILNQMVDEKIILSEASKNGAIPTDQEIDKKIAEVEASVGGKETLDSLLAQQGQTRISIRSQIVIPLALTKMYEKEATISADEVSKFIEQNKEQLRATDSAQQKKEAEDALKQQKLQQIFNQKFQELKTKAKIQIF